MKTKLSVMLALAGVLTFNVFSEVAQAEELTFFKDVPAQAWYKNDVEKLKNKGILDGYSDGTFKPQSNVTRVQAAKILKKTMDDYEIPLVKARPYSHFTDVGKNVWYYDYIVDLYEKGVVDGYKNNTFKPNEPMTRAQAAKMIQHSFLLKAKTTHDLPFSDIATKAWYLDYVKTLSSLEIVHGTNGMFRPNDYVTRSQFAAMVSRTMAHLDGVGEEKPIEPPIEPNQPDETEDTNESPLVEDKHLKTLELHLYDDFIDKQLDDLYKGIVVFEMYESEQALLEQKKPIFEAETDYLRNRAVVAFEKVPLGSYYFVLKPSLYTTNYTIQNYLFKNTEGKIEIKEDGSVLLEEENKNGVLLERKIPYHDFTTDRELFETDEVRQAQIKLALKELNEVRAENKLPALTFDSELLSFSTKRAKEIANLYADDEVVDQSDLQNQFKKHMSDKAHEYWGVSEVSAMAVGNGAEFINVLERSSEHLDFLLKKDTKSVGIDYFIEGNDIYWVMNFGLTK